MSSLRNPADARVHFSDLVHMASSPKHYRHHILHPKKPTQAMLVGAAADAMVFGVQTVVTYDGKRDERQQRWLDFQTAHSKDIILNPAEYDEARGVAEAVFADPVAKLALEGCAYQMTGQWEAHGLPWAAGIPGKRGGFDAVNLAPSARQLSGLDIQGPYVFDMKRTISGDVDRLIGHARARLWHAQLAAYVDGLRAMGHDIRNALLGCIEGKAPHDVTVIVLDERTLEEGRKCVASWCEAMRQCEASGHWPGRHQSAVRWEWREWGTGQDEEADDVE